MDYRFIDKDPLIDVVRTGFELSGKSKKFVAEKSGVSLQTLNNWLKGKTKRPQNLTLEFVFKALGIKRPDPIWLDTGEVVTRSRKAPETTLRLVAKNEREARAA